MKINDNTEYYHREISTAVNIAYYHNNFTHLEQLIEAGLDINHKEVHDSLKYSEFQIEPMEKLALLGFDVNAKTRRLEVPTFFNFFGDLEEDTTILKRVLELTGIDLSTTSESNLLNKFDQSLQSLSLEQADDYTLVFLKK